MVKLSWSDGADLQIRHTEGRMVAISAAVSEDGVPRRRYHKDLIRAGSYVKDADGLEFEVTATTLQHWADTFEQMKANGVKVPIPDTHANDGSAEHNMGWVESMFVEDSALCMTCELVGKKAIEAAAKCDVSIFSPPKFKDGKGKTYVRPIRHVALCTNPVVPGLGEFIPIAASQALSQETGMLEAIKKLAAKYGIKEEVTQENMDEILGKIEAEWGRRLKTAQGDKKLSDDKDEDKDKGKGDDKDKNGKPTLAASFQLSTGRKVEADPQIVKLVSDSRSMKLDSLVQAGRITPAVRDELAGKYVDSDAVALSLSQGDDGESFDVLVKAFTDNDPVKLAEQTGPQTVALSDNLKKDQSENPVVADAERRAKEAKERGY